MSRYSFRRYWMCTDIFYTIITGVDLDPGTWTGYALIPCHWLFCFIPITSVVCTCHMFKNISNWTNRKTNTSVYQYLDNRVPQYIFVCCLFPVYQGSVPLLINKYYHTRNVNEHSCVFILRQKSLTILVSRKFINSDRLPTDREIQGLIPDSAIGFFFSGQLFDNI